MVPNVLWMLPWCARNPLQTHRFGFFFYGYINIPLSVLLTLRHLCISCLPLSPLSTHLLPIFSSPPLLLSYLSPCAPPYLERDFFFYKERGDGKGGEGLKWEGCLFIRAASSRLHVATKTTARPAEGNVRRADTGACTRGTPHPTDRPPQQPPAASLTPSPNTGKRAIHGLTSDLWHTIYCFGSCIDLFFCLCTLDIFSNRR